jgi:hypothetical protein
MMPSAFDPQTAYQDAVNTSTSRLSSALVWALVIVAGLGIVALGSRRR